MQRADGDQHLTVLLGAGASAEAGVPTSFPMTRKIRDLIADDARRSSSAAFSGVLYTDLAAALNFVCGALIAYDSAAGMNPFDGVDVERVIAAVRLLARRSEIDEVTPFVALWHPGVDVRDRRANVIPTVDQAMRDAFDQPATSGRIEKVLEEFVDTRTGRSGTGDTYSALADLMVDRLRLLIQVQPKTVSYLRPLIERGKHTGGLTIATLNYDRSVEIAAQEAGVPLTTGLQDWLATGAWIWGATGIRLLKLHGSINWIWRERSSSSGAHELPRRDVVVAQTLDAGEPAMVFGRGAKLDAKGPFLGLLAQFEQLLSASAQLVVIGYSFRDDHVNEVIRRWLTDEAGHRVTIVDPGWRDQAFPFDRSFASELESFLKPSPVTPSASAESRIHIVREKCSDGLRTLFDL
jgi:SIR2-like protein